MTVLKAIFALCFFGTVLTLNPIVIKGNLFYDSVTQERFFIKGVTYDPIPSCVDGASDVLADDYPVSDWVYGHEYVDWRSDLEDIARMNVNAIRIYQIDPHKTHTKFMRKAESLGLYVVAPLTGSNFGKLDAQVPSPTCYSDQLGTDLLWFGRSVVKQLSEFNNTLMFMTGNELYLWSNSGHSFPCLKAFIRDLHSWQTGCGQSMRRVPLVYAMQDIGSPHREIIGAYLTSFKESEDDVLDVFGLNSYVYCADFWPWDEASPYFKLNEIYKTYAAPFVITEFGCQVNGLDARTFKQIPQMMQEMQETVSGGFVYEYSQHLKAWDQTGFGLVETKGSTCSADTERTWFDNAFALQAKYSADPWRKFDNVNGTWTDGTRCSWKPPTTLQHQRPDFPDVAAMDPGVSWSYDNWDDALPPTPEEDPAVSCPVYELSELELRENFCHGFVELPVDPPSRAPIPRPTVAVTPLPSPFPSRALVATGEPQPSPTQAFPFSNPNRPGATPSPTATTDVASQAPSSDPASSPTRAPSSIASSRRTSSQAISVAVAAEIAVLSFLVIALAAAIYCLFHEKRRNAVVHRESTVSVVAELALRHTLRESSISAPETDGHVNEEKKVKDEGDSGEVTRNPFHDGQLECENNIAEGDERPNGSDLAQKAHEPGTPIGSDFV